MKQISLENVTRWIEVSSDKLSHPVSIHTTCPECLLSVVFPTRRRHYDELRDTLACSAECPSCNIEVHFWMTDMVALSNAKKASKSNKGNNGNKGNKGSKGNEGNKEDQENNEDKRGTSSLFMMPATEARMNLEQVSHLLPETVLQYCQSTQDVYQTGNLTATRVMAQSTLDAIFCSFLPPGNSRTTLQKNVRDALPAINADQPLTNLASSLRKGEPLDRLLNSPEPASRETADALMHLIEKLVGFLYVEPTQFVELEQRLVELSQKLPVEDQRAESDSAED